MRAHCLGLQSYLEFFRRLRMELGDLATVIARSDSYLLVTHASKFKITKSQDGRQEFRCAMRCDHMHLFAIAIQAENQQLFDRLVNWFLRHGNTNVFWSYMHRFSRRNASCFVSQYSWYHETKIPWKNMRKHEKTWKNTCFVKYRIRVATVRAKHKR